MTAETQTIDYDIDVNALAEVVNEYKVDIDLSNVNLDGDENIKDRLMSYCTSLSPAHLKKYGDIPESSGYVCPITGFINVYIGAMYDFSFYVNGVCVSQTQRWDSDSACATRYFGAVKEGDVITYTLNSGTYWGGEIYYPYDKDEEV